MKELEQVAREAYRVLKKQGICAFMIGDIRQEGYVTLDRVLSMQKFIDVGFRPKETLDRVFRSSDYWNNIQKNIFDVGT